MRRSSYSVSNSFWSISILFHRLFGLFWSTFCLWSFATQVGKNPPSYCGTSVLKYLFEAVTIIFNVNWMGLQWWSLLTTVYWVLPRVWDDEWIGKRARIAGCKLTSSARIIFFSFNSYSEPYDKQLNNLDRSVVTGKSQTSAYCIDLAIGRSIRQGLGLRFSRNDRTVEVIK